MSGISILGIALGVVGSNLIDAQEAMASKAQGILKKQVMSVFDSERISPATSETIAQVVERKVQAHQIESSRSSYSFIRSAIACFGTYLPLVAVMFGMAYVIGRLSEWTLLESFYYMIITATTVGT
jgi:ABC-type polysaccharide/polyol phosphate export permease